MVVHDLNVEGIAFTATEDYPSLIVDANAPLVFTIAL
jgi:hypothetical protein